MRSDLFKFCLETICYIKIRLPIANTLVYQWGSMPDKIDIHTAKYPIYFELAMIKYMQRHRILAKPTSLPLYISYYQIKLIPAVNKDGRLLYPLTSKNLRLSRF